MREEMHQEGGGRNVKGQSEKHVARPLGHDARQFLVAHVKLVHDMAGR